MLEVATLKRAVSPFSSAERGRRITPTPVAKYPASKAASPDQNEMITTRLTLSPATSAFAYVTASKKARSVLNHPGAVYFVDTGFFQAGRSLYFGCFDVGRPTS